MVNTKLIYRFQGFYSLSGDPSLVEKRNRGYAKAIEVLKTAKKVATILSFFPYIRGVAVSGSLSKYYADDRSDIDFFIITAKNRLWIARTITHLLKKISFLFRKQHLLCMNYFIDEQRLEIVEQNIFTATEITTLMPMKGAAAFEKFYSSNKWIKKYFPNQFMRVTSAREIRGNIIKQFVELLFNNPLGNILDAKLMHITAKRWLKKTEQKKLNDHGIIMSMDVNKHYAKPDPVQFQAKLLNRYQRKVNELLSSLPERDNIVITHQPPGPIAL